MFNKDDIVALIEHYHGGDGKTHYAGELFQVIGENSKSYVEVEDVYSSVLYIPIQLLESVLESVSAVGPNSGFIIYRRIIFEEAQNVIKHLYSEREIYRGTPLFDKPVR